jgi:hypothetical protein
VAAVDQRRSKSCRLIEWLQGSHDRDRGPAVWLDKTQMQLHVRLTTDLNSNAGCVRYAHCRSLSGANITVGLGCALVGV